jgi:glycosyltransferase involved in cell wall biosynthesis
VVVGHIARLHPEKGHALLLRAFARAHPRLPGARLLIVGDGTLARSLRDEARRLAISDRVTFLGFQDDLVSLLVALDVFVLPSFAEGTPLAIYEAMAAGLPIIASNVPGIGELVHHGESGFLVPPGDLEALTDALIRLAGDAPELRASLGRRARAIARHDPRWSIETSTRRLESLYDMVVAQRGVRRECLM